MPEQAPVQREEAPLTWEEGFLKYKRDVLKKAILEQSEDERTGQPIHPNTRRANLRHIGVVLDMSNVLEMSQGQQIDQ